MRDEELYDECVGIEWGVDYWGVCYVREALVADAALEASASGRAGHRPLVSRPERSIGGASAAMARSNRA